MRYLRGSFRLRADILSECILYWWSFFCRLVFILAPILFALCGVRLADCGFGELLLFWLPAHLSYRVSVKYLSTNIRNARWSRIIDTILAPYLVIPVCWNPSASINGNSM